jgi:hypothetical protein
VDQADLTNNICGVLAKTVNNFRVTRSNFTIGGNDVATLTGADDQTFTAHHRGIFTTNGSGFWIEENHLEAPLGAAWAGEGIVVGYSREQNDQVYRNTTTRLDPGFAGEGICADVPTNTDFVGLVFKCNKSYTNVQDIWDRKVPLDLFHNAIGTTDQHR